jgi:hypothetical protein
MPRPFIIGDGADQRIAAMEYGRDTPLPWVTIGDFLGIASSLGNPTINLTFGATGQILYLPTWLAKQRSIQAFGANVNTSGANLICAAYDSDANGEPNTRLTAETTIGGAAGWRRAAVASPQNAGPGLCYVGVRASATNAIWLAWANAQRTDTLGKPIADKLGIWHEVGSSLPATATPTRPDHGTALLFSLIFHMERGAPV